MKLLILAGIALAGTLAAGTFTYSNVCSITTTVRATGQSTKITEAGVSGGCSLEIPFYNTQIRASGGSTSDGSNVVLAANGFYETPTVGLRQYALSDTDMITSYHSVVQTSVTFSERLETGGPSRLGFVQVFTAYQRDSYEDRGGPTLTVGGVSDLKDGSGDRGCPACFMPMVSFQLGGAFDLAFVFASYIDAGSMGAESNNTAGRGGFRLFEADGITPVAAFVTDPVATPEPGTVIATALGLVGVVFRRRRPETTIPSR
jgi:hypothetical protein